MIYYNLSFLSKLLDSLSLFANVSLTLYDDKPYPTDAHSHTNPSPFCNIIKTNLKDNCLTSDKYGLQPPKKDYYYCHFGLIEIPIPLEHNNSVIGYILVGPFRDPSKYSENLLRIEEFCREYNYDAQQMIDFYSKIEQFTQEKYNAIQCLCRALSKYALDQKLIWLKHSIFFDDLEPFIKKNLNQNLSVEFLSRKFFLSEKQLYTLFIKTTGKSPKKYITELRVLKARELLLTTNYPLDKIAETVGFSDYNYFIKVFKLLDGHKPSFYKKR